MKIYIAQPSTEVLQTVEKIVFKPLRITSGLYNRIIKPTKHSIEDTLLTSDTPDTTPEEVPSITKAKADQIRYEVEQILKQ